MSVSPPVPFPRPAPDHEQAGRRLQRRLAIGHAAGQWASAPAHVRALAGAYVGPLLSALEAIGRELDGSPAR